MTKSEKFCEL